MKCALCRLLFISAAFCEGFIAAADAEEVNGPGAVRERIGPLIKGKTLQLASTGESAVPDFLVTTAHPGVFIDAGHAAGRDFLVMRQEKDGVVLSIGAGDWGVSPSLERPGWLELAAGNQTVFSFSLAERKVDMAPVGFVADPVFNDRMHIDLGEGLRRFLAGEGVSSVRALESGGRWRLLQ